MISKKIAFMLLLIIPTPLMVFAQHKLSTQGQILQQQWNLTIEKPENAQARETLIQDAQATLKGYYYSMAINGSIIFHLKGPEETLLKKLGGKTWFDKTRLKKIETRQ